MVRILLFFILCSHSVWASQISIKFHENSGVQLVNGRFVAQKAQDKNGTATTTQIVINKDKKDIDFINNLISSTRQPPSDKGALVRPSFSGVDKRQLSNWKAAAEKFWKEDLEDLSLFFSISISDKEKDKIEEYMDLKRLDIVESIEFIPTPEPAVPTPFFEGNQGYLDNNTNGLHARRAWNLAGGRGDTIKLVDVEGAWVTNHEDFPSLFYSSGGFTSDVG